jgi:hypothetical protein
MIGCRHLFCDLKFRQTPIVATAVLQHGRRALIDGTNQHTFDASPRSREAGSRSAT